MMHGHEKSDHAIVAGKPTNKAEGSAAELVERRAGQGECAPSKHAPDTVPGSACHRRWPHAYDRVFDDAFGPR